MQTFGKALLVMGLVMVIAGAIVYFAGNRFNWFGNLPGDIKYEKDNFKLFIPFTSMLLASVVLSLILYLINKFR